MISGIRSSPGLVPSLSFVEHSATGLQSASGILPQTNGTQMLRKQQIIHTPKSSKLPRTGHEKMQMSYDRMRRDIKRILTERAKSADTGKPHHQLR
jgi:hypothetical protein